MLLKNCRLIPELADGWQFEYADIRIENGKIKEIRKAAFGESPLWEEGEEVYDCRRNTLLPGLFDLHAHLSISSAREEPMDAMKQVLRVLEWLPRYAEHGVTAIRDCGSSLRLAIPLRDAVKKGWISGPRILAAGYMLGPQCMYQLGKIQTAAMEIANTEDEFRAAARMELSQGADFIKLYASQSASQSENGSPAPILRREEIRAAVEIAEMAGTYVAAHAHSLAAIQACIREGVRSIEHASLIDEETIEALKGRNDVYLVPTLAVLAPENDPSAGPEQRKVKERMLTKTADRIANAYRAGLKLGFGTDLYNGRLSCFFKEFQYRKEKCGMKNIDILLQATKYSAEIAGIADVTGEIKEGLAADLILMPGNPDEDIYVMDKRPLLVLREGKRLAAGGEK